MKLKFIWQTWGPELDSNSKGWEERNSRDTLK